MRIAIAMFLLVAISAANANELVIDQQVFEVCFKKGALRVATPAGKTGEFLMQKGWEKISCNSKSRTNQFSWELGLVIDGSDYGGQHKFLLTLANGREYYIYGNNWEQSLLETLK